MFLPLFGSLALNLNMREEERQCFRQAVVRIRGQERTTSLLLILWNCLKNDSAFGGIKITASSRFSIRRMYSRWKVLLFLKCTFLLVLPEHLSSAVMRQEVQPPSGHPLPLPFHLSFVRLSRQANSLAKLFLNWGERQFCKDRPCSEHNKLNHQNACLPLLRFCFSEKAWVATGWVSGRHLS